MKLIDTFNFQQMRATSVVLYECVADNVNYAEFFQTFDLPDTFNSWFLVTEFHVWMLLMRVMNEGSESGEDGRFMRNCVVEAMWADVTQRARKLGVRFQLIFLDVLKLTKLFLFLG